MSGELAVFWHDDVLLHDTGRGMAAGPLHPWLDVDESHPESAARVQNMQAILARGPLSARIAWHDGRHATEEELAAVHTHEHIERMKATCAKGAPVAAYSPTMVHSWAAATASAGTALAAGTAVLDGDARRAYALVRPPGHHAAPSMADGYCLFNQVALVAARARSHGLDRVMILDWDVHHGNGTQSCFYDRADVLTISLHMDHGAWDPVTHPETGAVSEIGRGPGEGYNLNVPLPLGVGDHGYGAVMKRIVEPAARWFRPDLIVIANGQDAALFDPDGGMAITMDGFRNLGAAAAAMADEHTDGRLVLVQEGGYARTYAAWCALAVAEGVVGAEATADPVAFFGDRPGTADEAIAEVLALHPIFRS